MNLKVKEKIDCCGSNFETDQVSFFGLLTFSTPLIILCLILIILSYPFSFIPVVKSILNNILIISKANLTLIEKQIILTNIKCNFVALASNVSLNLSRVISNYFNLSIFVIIWFIIISGVLVIV